MRRLGFWLCAVAGILLSAAGPSLAYYHPTAGRWVARDPEGGAATVPTPASGSLPDFVGRVAKGATEQYRDGLNLYQYCRSGPTALNDATGQAAPVVVAGAAVVAAASACAAPFAAYAESNWGGVRTDKFKHCWVSCMMSRTCGGALAEAMGVLKESMDSAVRIGQTVAGARHEPWMDSLLDLEANQKCIGWESLIAGPVGGWIGAMFRDSCECCCLRYFQ